MSDLRTCLIGGLALLAAAISAPASATEETLELAAPEAPAAIDEAGAAAPAAGAPETKAAAKAKKQADKKQADKKRRAEKTAAKGAAVDDPSVARPPMWRVADADTEIVLVGTFHVLPPHVGWRSPELGRALDQSDEVWFEAEVDTRAAEEETRRILTNEGFLPAGRTLTSALSEDAAARLNDVAASLSLPMSALDRMRPWQAFLALSVQYIVSRGFDPGAGLESGLIREARARGRQLVFLETVSQQLGFFTNLKPETETALLELTLREWDDQAEDFDRLFDAWRRGDPEAIDDIMNAAMRDEAPDVYDVLLKRRNAVWADRLAAAMSVPGRKLVAVGAAHLAGPDSVPAMLAAKGLAVTRYGAGEAPESEPEAAAEAATEAATDGDEAPDLAAGAAGEEALAAAAPESAEAPAGEPETDQIEDLLETLAPELIVE